MYHTTKSRILYRRIIRPCAVAPADSNGRQTSHQTLPDSTRRFPGYVPVRIHRLLLSPRVKLQVTPSQHASISRKPLLSQWIQRVRPAQPLDSGPRHTRPGTSFAQDSMLSSQLPGPSPRSPSTFRTCPSNWHLEKRGCFPALEVLYYLQPSCLCDLSGHAGAERFALEKSPPQLRWTSTCGRPRASVVELPQLSSFGNSPQAAAPRRSSEHPWIILS